MLLPVPPTPAAERHRQFLARNPGYHAARKRVQRAGGQRAWAAMVQAMRQAAHDERQAALAAESTAAATTPEAVPSVADVVAGVVDVATPSADVVVPTIARASPTVELLADAPDVIARIVPAPSDAIAA